jgi:septal ring factor EnvC (AmiA/AmiB activator)
MSDASNVAKSLRERLSGTTEERLGKALSDLLENPLLTGAIGRAFDAREKAVQAQEVAMGALNIPSASDIERLTRRLRSVSNRLEGIEDGVDRLDRAMPPAAPDNLEIEHRLSAIEAQLKRLTDKLEQGSTPQSAPQRSAAKATRAPQRAKAKTSRAKPPKG